MTKFLNPQDLNGDFSDWIANLYEHSLALNWTEFKSWTLSQLKDICAFDSGLWWSRSDLANKQNVKWAEDTNIHNLPSNFMDNYARLASDPLNLDPLNLQLHSQPGEFISLWDVCTKKDWYRTVYYGEHCSKYAIENAISALVLPSEFSSVTHIFSFYSDNSSPDFSEQDKTKLTMLLPHLLQSFQMNLLAGIEQKNRRSVGAAVDRFGEIILAEEGFIPLMKSLKLFKNGRVRMPQLPSITHEIELNIEDVELTLEFHDGVILISIYPACLLSRLSGRQREVCELISKGLTNKEIARFLGLQLNTVNNHVQNVLKVLQVRSREAATAYLLKQTTYERR